MKIRCISLYSVVSIMLSTNLTLTGQPAPPAPARVVLTTRLVDGLTAISGVTDANAILRFMDVDSNTLLATASNAAVTADANGLFSAMLSLPLFAGQRVQFQEQKSSDNPFVDVPGGPVPVEGAGDFGRFRTYFAAGMVLASDSQFQSQSSLFLSFDADKNFRWAGARAEPVAGRVRYRFNHRWMWNTFFGVRMTSVPESQQVKPDTTTTPPAGTPAATTMNSTDNLTTFLNSRKSAELQGGNYFPILTNVWNWQGAPNAFFVAPLMKVGFVAPISSSSGDTTSTGAPTQPVNASQFYNFYGYGGRIGHMKLSTDKNISPEILSYLDVIVGRYSNLETLTPVVRDGKPVIDNGTPEMRPIRQYRIGIEGLMKVPRTPAVLGFSANIGQNLTGVPHTTAAKDDLRFFFGLRFDVGKLIAKIPQF